MENNIKYNSFVKKSKMSKIAVPTIEGFSLIDYDDVIYLEAEGNYTQIYLSDNQKILSSKNIGFYEELLVDEPFMRIHNSWIIHLNKIKSYIRADNGWIVLKNGKLLKVAKSKKNEILELFQLAVPNNKQNRQSIIQ